MTPEAEDKKGTEKKQPAKKPVKEEKPEPKPEVKSELLEKIKKDLGDKIKESHSYRERRLQLVIDSRYTFEIAKYLKEKADFDHLSSITGVEYEDRWEVVYHFFSWRNKNLMQVNARMEKVEEPEFDSLSLLWDTADWHERETYDLIGIKFEGHPDLKRILLPDDYEGHPLRKDVKLKAAPWYSEEE